jgi:hypothetical protein
VEVDTEVADVVLEVETEIELEAVPVVLRELGETALDETVLDETVLDELVTGGTMGAAVLSM